MTRTRIGAFSASIAFSMAFATVSGPPPSLESGPLSYASCVAFATLALNSA